MPDSKTIEIDEILTPEKPVAGSESSPDRDSAASAGSSAREPSGSTTGENFDPDQLFSRLHKSLPWKALLTLALTRWFMLLRSKKWGMLILVPLIILSALLAIPLIAIAIVVITLRSVFFPRRG